MMIDYRHWPHAWRLGIRPLVTPLRSFENVTPGRPYQVIDFHEDLDQDKPGFIIIDDVGNRVGYFVDNRFKEWRGEKRK